MGWRSTLRTLGAIAREAERNAQRRQRAHQKYLLALDKAQKLQQAADAARDFQEHLNRLVSVHKTGSAQINWHEDASAHPPSRPVESDGKTLVAQQALASYSPSWFASLLGFDKRKRKALEAKVLAARDEDAAENHKNQERFQKELAEHASDQRLAQRVLAFEKDAVLEVIRTVSPFATLSELGSDVEFTVKDTRWIVVELNVHSESVIPKETITLLQSGRASVKKMPKGDFYRLYQDHVCSAVLRVARELFALLPLDGVTITAKDELLNSATGHLELQPILSVCIPRATFDTLNFATLDPSDSMRNFRCNMDFKPTLGFRPVLAFTEPPASVEKSVG